MFSTVERKGGDKLRLVYLSVMHFFSLPTVMDAAITSLNIRVGCQRNEYQFWYNQGSALAKAGRYFEALASFDQAKAIQPDDGATWVFRGVVLILLNRYSEALASCEKALAIHPNDKQAWIVRGAASHYLGHYKQAYASYDRALGIQRQSGWQKLTQLLKRLFRLGNDSGTSGTTTVTISS